MTPLFVTAVPVDGHGLHVGEELCGEADPVEVALHHAQPLHAPPELLRPRLQVLHHLGDDTYMMPALEGGGAKADNSVVKLRDSDID